MKKPKDDTYTLRINAQDLRELHAIAEQHDLTVAQILRHGVQIYIQKHGGGGGRRGGQQLSGQN